MQKTCQTQAHGALPVSVIKSALSIRIPEKNQANRTLLMSKIVFRRTPGEKKQAG